MKSLPCPLWLTSDYIIPYHLIIFAVLFLDREQILLTLAGKSQYWFVVSVDHYDQQRVIKPVSRALPVEMKQHIICSLKCILFLAKAWHVLMKRIQLRFCFISQLDAVVFWEEKPISRMKLEPCWHFKTGFISSDQAM